MFTKEVLDRIGTTKDIVLAKTIALDAVNTSGASDANKAKATAMILNAKGHTPLLQGVWGFSLAHQGLKKI
jgi:hypothetical protein